MQARSSSSDPRTPCSKVSETVDESSFGRVPTLERRELFGSTDPVRPELDETLEQPSGDKTATLPPAAKPGARGELVSGMRLGHFRIERLLGAGGMGEVYLATDLALDRPVAVKVLPAGVASGTARDRMTREARAQARINHANVGHIYFIGEEDGRLYFAMEYVAGKTLAERLEAGPLPVQEALAVIRSAALGLREAQRSGFMHRDVKPSNLMVDGNGMLKVLDFGLAAATPERASDGPVAQTTLAGTPLYMAPEQARGEPIDLRADIYALGATLYHLVAGKPPFRAETVEELITLHASAARPALPRGGNARTQVAAIDDLIARMMAPTAADRFASYDDLLRAIEMVSAAHTRPAGLWVRAIAMSVDMIIVGLIEALTIDFITGGGDLGMMTLLLGMALLTGFTIGRWGTTPGKALFELEVVDVATAHRPRYRQAFARQLLMVGLPATVGVIANTSRHFHVPIPNWVISGFGVASLLLVVVNLLHAVLRVPGKRTFWDRRSQTQVRYRRTDGPPG